VDDIVVAHDGDIQMIDSTSIGAPVDCDAKRGVEIIVSDVHKAV
jgi:hypothetical protein